MGNYLRAVWRCRFFWLSLVKMDLRTRYRRSILGMGWSLLHPIAMTVTICAVFQHLMAMDVWHYAPYLLAGLACWNYILSSTTTGCQSLLQGESYIRQYPAPIAIYPLRTTLGATIHFLIALSVVLGLMWYIRWEGLQGRPAAAAALEKQLAADAKPDETAPAGGPAAKALAARVRPAEVEETTSRAFDFAPLISLIPTLFLLFTLCWSLGVLAGFANVFFQDTQHLCEVGFQIFFYLTPIIYDKKLLEGKRMAWVIAYNPLVPILDLIREPIVEGRFPTPLMYGLAALTVSLVAGAAILALVRLQRRVIFYM